MPAFYKTLKTARNATAIVMVLVIVAVVILRFITIGLNEYRTEIESKLSGLTGADVKVADVSITWKSANPEIKLQDVRLIYAEKQQDVIRLNKAYIEIDLLKSLLTRELMPSGLIVDGANIHIVRHKDRTLAIQGFGISDTTPDETESQYFSQWLLAHPYIGLKNCTIQWRDQYRNREFSFSNINLNLKNENEKHYLSGSVGFPEKIGRTLQFEIAIDGDVLASSDWSGSLKTKGTQLGVNVFLDELGRDYLALSDGMVSFDLQGRFENARIQSVEGELELNAIQLVNQNDFIKRPADVDIGHFKWLRNQEDWVLDISKVVFTEANNKDKGNHIKIAVSNNNIQVDIDKVMNRSISQIALMFGKLDKEMIDAITTMQPEGKLIGFHTSFNLAGQGIEQLAFTTELDNMSIKPWHSIPGFRNLSGMLNHKDDAGSFKVETEHNQVQINIPRVFRKSWPMKEIEGEVKWTHKDKVWEISTDKIDLVGKDIEMQVTALVRIEENISPYIDISATFEDGNAEQVYSYLPVVIMPDEVVKWLDHSIVSGHVKSGTAVFKGQVQDFPFTKNNGQFKVDFMIENALLDYMTGWPRIDQIEAQVVFSGNSMNIEMAAAKIFDADVLGTHISIPAIDADHPILKIKGRVDATTRDGIAFLKRSPLKEKFSYFLPEKEVKGKCDINLDLGISLSNKPNTTVGSIRFKNNELTVNHDLVVNRINGGLDFSNTGITNSKLSGRFLGDEITANIYSEVPEGTHESNTIVEIVSRLDIAKLMKQHNWPWLIYFSGASDWQAKIKFPQSWGEGKGHGQLHIESTLSGMDINLPSPLAKKPDEIRTLEMEVDLSANEIRQLSMLYGKDISGVFELENKNNKTSMSRGAINLGSEGIELPEKSLFKLSGDLSRIDIDNWITFSKSQSIIKPEASNLTLLLDADHLHIEKNKAKEEGAIKKQDTFDPRDIPRMFVKAKRFTYGKAELGQLGVEVVKVPDGLQFKDITLNSTRIKANGGGSWLYVNEAHQSLLKLKVEHESFGELLSQLDYANEFEGSKSNSDLDVKWAGSPYDWSLQKVEGKI
ncbi:MAG: DUF3971 domain-containing protein, partial [Gammaproteobacteria bacterium]|nr:DUF3971 domain-containing protein [Gammaproteobacteria bacterium]